MKVHSHIAEALGVESMIALIMLAVLVAVDVIDHPILLKRSNISVGIRENVLTYVKSYLQGIHSDSVADKTSSGIGLHFTVPQGSVLGPINYCMYIKPVGQSIKRHNIKCSSLHKLKSCDKCDDISSSIEVCIEDIRILDEYQHQLILTNNV